MSIRVLVVDDSAFARKVLREALEVDPGIEIVGVARDGLEALEKIADLKPDVVTLDLVMPNLDGLGVLQALPVAGQHPRVVAVSIADEESALGLEALQAGAVDVVHKPTALATSRLYELGDELRKTVRVAASARVPERATPAREPVSSNVAGPRSCRLVVVGASTGGPQAITRLLRDLPADLPVPIAIVVHMPVEYTRAFAERLDEDSALDVREAEDGMVLRPGLAVIARGGQHLYVDERGPDLVARLSHEPMSSLHRPAADVLFRSVCALGPAVVAVVLTGMGDDGLEGARDLSSRGGVVLTEAESSCVVYGMPRSIVDAGLSTKSATISDMARLLTQYL